MFEFMANKANAQYRQLKKKNDTALVWMDEPGLQMLFGIFYRLYRFGSGTRLCGLYGIVGRPAGHSSLRES